MTTNIKQKCLLMVVFCVLLIASTTALATESKDTSNFDHKLAVIEERTMILHMVIKKLSHTFKKANKDHAFMLEKGMDPKDVNRLEHAYQKKIQKMINEAVKEIEHI